MADVLPVQGPKETAQQPEFQVMTPAGTVIVPQILKDTYHPSDGIVEHYVKTLEEPLGKVIVMHNRYWDNRLLLLLLANKASTHETTGIMLISMIFGRNLCLPCDLLFGLPRDKEQTMTDYVTDLVECLYDIHHYVNI
jgi:hypothetical protein